MLALLLEAVTGEMPPEACPRCGCPCTARKGRDAGGGRRRLCRGCGRAFRSSIGRVLGATKLPALHSALKAFLARFRGPSSGAWAATWPGSSGRVRRSAWTRGRRCSVPSCGGRVVPHEPEGAVGDALSVPSGAGGVISGLTQPLKIYCSKMHPLHLMFNLR